MAAYAEDSEKEAELELLRAVKAGDATAYQGLVEKYQGRIYSMVYGMIRNREDARDITQEAFVKAYRSLGSFRLEASFYTWIYRIAMNLTIDFTRKRKRRKQSGFDESIGTRDEKGDIAEVLDDVAVHASVDQGLSVLDGGGDELGHLALIAGAARQGGEVHDAEQERGRAVGLDEAARHRIVRGRVVRPGGLRTGSV